MKQYIIRISIFIVCHLSVVWGQSDNEITEESKAETVESSASEICEQWKQSVEEQNLDRMERLLNTYPYLVDQYITRDDGFDPTRTAAVYAMQSLNIEMFHLLIKYGLNIWQQYERNSYIYLNRFISVGCARSLARQEKELKIAEFFLVILRELENASALSFERKIEALGEYLNLLADSAQRNHTVVEYVKKLIDKLRMQMRISQNLTQPIDRLKNLLKHLFIEPAQSNDNIAAIEVQEDRPLLSDSEENIEENIPQLTERLNILIPLNEITANSIDDLTLPLNQLRAEVILTQELRGRDPYMGPQDLLPAWLGFGK